MKKINIGDGLTLIADINKTDNILTISINDKKSKNNSVLNNYYINTCETCGNKFISKEKLQFCPSCFAKVVNFANKMSKNAENEPKEANKSNLKNNAKKIKHRVIYYGKSTLADNNIIIDNLTEVHNLVGDYITKARLETWLRFAIMGLNYEQIAKMLAVKTESVKVDYRVFARRGVVRLDGNKPIVTSTVKYHIESDPTARVLSLPAIPKMNEAAKTAYKCIGEFLNDWINYDTLMTKVDKKRHTLVNYVHELYNCGLIEKRMVDRGIEVRFKR